jgi:oligoribonuclease NrnB/cAMP/cGMP phosphodiesterase (DHH superfamily)
MDKFKNLKNLIDTVIYHDPCQDGFSAAWVAYHYNKNIKLIPKRINADPIEPELYIGKNVLMVDIVTNDFKEIKQKANNLLILDHHITNQESLKDIDYAYFDMHKSGVGLAWEFFFGDEPIPKFIACIQDRDIWTCKIFDAKAFCDGLYNMLTIDDEVDYNKRLYNKLKLYNELYKEWTVQKTDKFDYYYKIGEVLDKIAMNKVKSMVRNLDLYKVKLENKSDLKAAIFNCSHGIANDLGNYAVENTDADFAIMWRYNHEDEKYYYSLRSKDSKCDVSRICRLFGGGGHRNAAGCASKLHPKELFQYYK